MEIKVLRSLLQMIIQDSVHGLVDTQFQVFLADYGESVVADILDNNIVGRTVQTALNRSFDANVTAVALPAVVSFASGDAEDIVTESSVSAFHYVGGDIFEQLRFIVWESDQQIDEQPFSPERDDFIISKHTLSQQCMSAGIDFQNAGFKLKLFVIQMNDKAKG